MAQTPNRVHRVAPARSLARRKPTKAEEARAASRLVIVVRSVSVCMSRLLASRLQEGASSASAALSARVAVALSSICVAREPPRPLMKPYLNDMCRVEHY